jgi:hypothetical protein
MSDAGEGLIDAESRIQERMEEVARDRSLRRAAERNPQQRRAVEALESLRLARTELRRQLAATSHEARRSQLTHALEELERRIAETSLLLH